MVKMSSTKYLGICYNPEKGDGAQLGQRPSIPKDAGLHAPDNQTNAFTGQIRPIRPSFFYLVGLFLTATLMVLLPIAYLAIIAGIGYAVYWHATTHANWISSGLIGFNAVKFKIIGFVGPIICGLVLLFFMIKPLLARRVDLEEPLSLDRGQEPRLFAFVDAFAMRLVRPSPAASTSTAGLTRRLIFGEGHPASFATILYCAWGYPLSPE